MVLLFLGDSRGALIVVLTIPVALLSSVIFLNMTGQRINIMTLGGLALAVGILVDEATVTIENIHRHQMRFTESKSYPEPVKKCDAKTADLIQYFAVLPPHSSTGAQSSLAHVASWVYLITSFGVNEFVRSAVRIRNHSSRRRT